MCLKLDELASVSSLKTGFSQGSVMENTESQVINDLKELRKWVEADPETSRAIRKLEDRSIFRSIIAVGTGYLGFSLALYLIFVGHWAGILAAVLIIGNRLQSFENLLHEAGHGNLARSQKVNDWIAEYLIALPILKSFPLYKPMHLRHHRYLGDPEKDPDFIPSPKPGEPAMAIFMRKFGSRLFIRHALIGEILRCSWLARFKLVAFWGVVGGILFALTDGMTVLKCLAWWTVARLTVYHFLMVFQEISDHQGLDPGGVFSFSRNAPLDFLAPVFHPHYSGLHLTHHLRPKVPFYNLPEADLIFLSHPKYAEAARCETYLTGENSVVQSWRGKQLKPTEDGS